MLLTYRGSVNRWECDENDHLNVRFYLARHVEILQAGLAAQGLDVSDAELGANISAQHIRFHQEARIAAPMSGYFARARPVQSGEQNARQAYTELRHSETDTVLCSCIHDLRDELGSPDQSFDQGIDVPDYAQPRGVSVAQPRYLSITKDALAECGFIQIGMGVVGGTEVDGGGCLSLPGYMGRLSDSMPHLWMLLGGAEASNSAVVEGGAVLEYRLRYHRALQLGAHFGIYSGLLSTGAKVQVFGHLVFDEAAQHLVASAESCGVRMDLHTRKAITLSPQRQAAMNYYLLKV